MDNVNDQLHVTKYWDEVIEKKFIDNLNELIKKIDSSSKIDKNANELNDEEIRKTKNTKVLLNTFSIIFIFVFLGISIFVYARYSSVAMLSIGGFLSIILIIILLVCNRSFKKKINELIDNGYKQMQSVNKFITNGMFLQIYEDITGTDFYNFLEERSEVNPLIIYPHDSNRIINKYLVAEHNKHPFVICEYNIFQFNTSNKSTYVPRCSSKTIGFYLVSKPNNLNYSLGKSDVKLENYQFEKHFSLKRNDEQQFRLVFTVLAQEELVKLYERYGTIKLTKQGEACSVEFDNHNDEFFSINASAYHHYSFKTFMDELPKKVMSFYKSLYKYLSPFLAIPLYQHFPYAEKKRIYDYSEIETEIVTNREMKMHYFQDDKNNMPISFNKCDYLNSNQKYKILSIKNTSFKHWTETVSSGSGKNRTEHVEHYYKPLYKYTYIYILEDKKNIFEKKNIKINIPHNQYVFHNKKIFIHTDSKIDKKEKIITIEK